MGHLLCVFPSPTQNDGQSSIHNYVNLMSVCPCIVDDTKRENQLDAT